MSSQDVRIRVRGARAGEAARALLEDTAGVYGPSPCQLKIEDIGEEEFLIILPMGYRGRTPETDAFLTDLFLGAANWAGSEGLTVVMEKGGSS